MPKELRNRTINTEDPNMSANDLDATLGAVGGVAPEINNFSFGSGETRIAGFNEAQSMFAENHLGARRKSTNNTQKEFERTSFPNSSVDKLKNKFVGYSKSFR